MTDYPDYEELARRLAAGIDQSVIDELRASVRRAGYAGHSRHRQTHDGSSHARFRLYPTLRDFGDTGHTSPIRVPNLADPGYISSDEPFVLWVFNGCLRATCTEGFDVMAPLDRPPQEYCEHQMLMEPVPWCPECRNRLVALNTAGRRLVHSDRDPMQCRLCGWDSVSARAKVLPA